MDFRKIDPSLFDLNMDDIVNKMDPTDPIADAIGANFWQRICIWLLFQIFQTYYFGPLIGRVIKALGFEELGSFIGM